MSHDVIPDDLWVDRLRERADRAAPDVPTDVDVTLRRGRRRRTVRRVAVVGGVAVVALAVALGAAPAMRFVADDATPAVLPEDSEVVIDTTDGTITLPLDRYSLTEQEQAEVVQASALAMRACAADRGYEITDPVSESLLDPATEPNPVGDRRFGVWWLPSAEQFGYGVWGVPAQRYGVAKRVEDEARTGEQQAILDRCGETPAVQQFWPSTELSEVPPDFIEQAVQSDAGQLVLREWGDCLASHGLYRDEGRGRWAVTDGKRNSGDTLVANGGPLDETSAVVDARCKEDVELVPRLAQMVADLQAPFIEAHRGELTAVRARLDVALHSAREYVAQHP
ncbi:hypothetical protein Cch01nite_13570 [Cellulomonas chitinilytica]|uniref:Uncharacterized protein n=1 Tax=Cellulomonas chitinilytica TaxID=398759 RepID=A0A919TZ98_9CELL|nr:hypothetical protein [Cellulomonas chitinilytica]GIG20633.1 hypothetical protein Cch01nite_13570 [Cellulomonas chitinilytica]